MEPFRDEGLFGPPDVDCVAGMDGVGSVAFAEDADFGLLLGSPRSELVTRITGSTLVAATASSRYGDDGSLCLRSLCFEFLDDVSRLRLGLSWVLLGRPVGSGAFGSGLRGDFGGDAEIRLVGGST